MTSALFAFSCRESRVLSYMITIVLNGSREHCERCAVTQNPGASSRSNACALGGRPHSEDGDAFTNNVAARLTNCK